MSPSRPSRLWQLRLIPDVRFGRWLTALAVLTFMVSLYLLTGPLRQFEWLQTWSAALFFCVIVAYIIPVFHYITERTQAALDALTPILQLSSDELAAQRMRIDHKSIAWHATNIATAIFMWLLQSWLLAGSFINMVESLTANLLSFSMIMGTLLVWFLVNQAIHALVDNARLFRRLSQYIDFSLLDVSSLRPFGDMAIGSTLMIIGSVACMGILWLDADTNPWTTIPGLVAMLGAVVFLLFATVSPVRDAIIQAKQKELRRVQQLIAQQSQDNPPESLAGLLSYRREITLISEWPFNVGSLTRLVIYVFIVPLAWIGAALIENLVDLFISG